MSGLNDDAKELRYHLHAALYAELMALGRRLEAELVPKETLDEWWVVGKPPAGDSG